MAASPSRLPLDRAVRYAVSDALASVKSYIDDLEYNQRRSNQELVVWKNYLAELRTLHQLLLSLPSLETADWLTDEQAEHAPTFTPFVSGLSDAKTNVRRIYTWLLSLSSGSSAKAASNLENNSDLLEQQKFYTHQIDQVLTQLQLLPKPGTNDWYDKYQPAVEQVESEVLVTSAQPLVSAVA